MRASRAYAGGVPVGWPAARGGLVAVSLAMLLGTGCAHRGSAASTLPPTPSASPVAAATARATVTILVPRNVKHLRRPAYVSPSTTALSISVNNGTPVVATLTPTSPGCTTNTQGLSCTVNVDAPIGKDTFAVVALDSGGNALSRATVPATIAAGQANPVALTLDGIVAQIVVSLPDPPPPVGTATTVSVLVTTEDSDGNIIVGPGGYDNPITLTDSDSSGATTLSTTTVIAPSTTVTLSYNGQAMSTPATIGASAPNVLAGAITSAVFAPASSSATKYVDWSTFGYDLARTGYNPHETAIGVGNAPNLKLLWSVNLGLAIIAQPVLAQGVSIKGTLQNVLYVGTQGDPSTGMAQFFAINADTGAIIWQNIQLGAVAYRCSYYPFGAAGTATFDRATNRVYVADGQDKLHAFDMSTGVEASGWPVTVATDPGHNFIYAGLTLNPANGLLYVETSSTCDISPWNGRIVAVNSANGSLVGTFYPTQGASGGGIWGYGGASIGPDSNVYIATGNSDTAGGAAQNLDYAESVVKLNPSISSVLSWNKPNFPSGPDIDFGATPMLFQAPGCPLEVIALNKSGDLVLYDAANIGNGPLQQIQMAPSSDFGNFIGSPAYSPATNLVYVPLPIAFGSYVPGLAAMQVVPNPSGAANCTLSLKWNTPFGTDGAAINSTGYDAPRSPPSVANGVVYEGEGLSGQHVVALDAQTGAVLWTSSTTGVYYTQPVIDGGHLFVSSYGGVLYAFGL